MTVQENIHRVHKTQKQINTHKQNQLHRNIYTHVTNIYILYIFTNIDRFLIISRTPYLHNALQKCFLEENFGSLQSLWQMHCTHWNALKIQVVHGDVQLQPEKQMGVTAAELCVVDTYSQVITCPPEDEVKTFVSKQTFLKTDWETSVL